MKTSIVCTIGPVSNNPDMLMQLYEAGMRVARLNGSHSDLDWHAQTIELIKSTIKPNIPILLDIPGRKIRTLQLAHEPKFKKGDEIILTTDQSHDGTVKVPVNYVNLHQDLKAGDSILADDGALQFNVASVDNQDIILTALCDGKLRSKKGINAPYVKLKTELVTDRDREMIRFAEEYEIDYIGISFVESAHHINEIRKVIRNSHPRIVAKVENQGSIDHIEEICEATDAIMIDRGDLSVETSLEQTAIFQKQIIRRATHYGKPVIVATEMLHSMIDKPVPTKAEVSDIANAVIDGCAATMLSGETAIGKFPVEAVKMMNKISEATLNSLSENQLPDEDVSIPETMTQAISLICRNLPITKIIAITISGYAARMVAACKPRQKIIAVSNDPITARSFNLYFGTEGVYIDTPFSKKSTDHIAFCLKELWRQGKINDDDTVLITSLAYPNSGNRMNMLETHVIKDLRESLEW